MGASETRYPFIKKTLPDEGRASKPVGLLELENADLASNRFLVIETRRHDREEFGLLEGDTFERHRIAVLLDPLAIERRRDPQGVHELAPLAVVDHRLVVVPLGHHSSGTEVEGDRASGEFHTLAIFRKEFRAVLVISAEVSDAVGPLLDRVGEALLVGRVGLVDALLLLRDASLKIGERDHVGAERREGLLEIGLGLDLGDGDRSGLGCGSHVGFLSSRLAARMCCFGSSDCKIIRKGKMC